MAFAIIRTPTFMGKVSPETKVGVSMMCEEEGKEARLATGKLVLIPSGWCWWLDNVEHAWRGCWKVGLRLTFPMHLQPGPSPGLQTHITSIPHHIFTGKLNWYLKLDLPPNKLLTFPKNLFLTIFTTSVNGNSILSVAQAKILSISSTFLFFSQATFNPLADSLPS